MISLRISHQLRRRVHRYALGLQESTFALPKNSEQKTLNPYTAELGSSANRLQAAAMHADFNNRLLTFYHSGRGRMLGAPW